VLSIPDERQAPFIELALDQQRLRRYMPAAENDIHTAFRFYIWNCQLCEAFYLPLHFVEILVRNALHRALRARLGIGWYKHSIFIQLLDEHYRFALEDAVSDEARNGHGTVTDDDIVSALPFSFWQHLATKRFERFIWAKGVRLAFPYAEKESRREDLFNLVESVRRWRNRIAHHRAIFDKGPMRTHTEILVLLKWVCPETSKWVASGSRVPQVLALRPKVGVGH
jgi:hypothetical protein